MSGEYEPSPVDFVADHVERYEATAGADGAVFNGVPCVVLTTTGRRSGQARKSPLVRVHDGTNYVIVASMGGNPTNPLWYANLEADPDVTLQDGDAVLSLRARTTAGDERRRLWEAAVAVFPDYNRYATKCDREIPVVVLEPRR